jgi:hypothetical protein
MGEGESELGADSTVFVLPKVTEACSQPHPVRA